MPFRFVVGQGGYFGVLALLGFASLGHAQAAEGFELEWNAPEGCPSRDDVLARVRGHLPAHDSSRTALAAQVSVTQVGSAFQIGLQLRDRGAVAHRTLTAESCDAAAEVAALLIALAVDPHARLERVPEAAEERRVAPRTDATGDRSRDGGAVSRNEDSSATRAASTIKEVGSAADADRPSEVARSAEAFDAGAKTRVDIALGAALTADVGMLPQSPAWGVRPSVAVSIDRLRTGVGLALLFPGHADAPDYGGAVLEGRGILADALLGVDLVRGRGSFVLYGAGEVAALSVSAAGISDPGAGRATWAAAGAGLQTGYAVAERWRVIFDASARLPLLRARWLVRTDQGDVTALAASSAALRISLGLAYVLR
jgi:hypothetical protein